MDDQKIDWSAYADFPEDTVSCKCGASFKSHGKLVMRPRPHVVTEKLCPNCKQNDGAISVKSAPVT